MKFTSLIFALVCPFVCANAQTASPIDSFAGIKFGSTKATVILLASNTGAKPDAGESKKNVLVFSNLPFANRTAEVVYFTFSDDRFVEARAFFKPDLQQQALILYDRLKNNLALKYGEGVETKRFISPYTDGDGNELAALEVGKAILVSKWVEDKENGKYNSIELRANQDMYSSIVFTEVRPKPKK